MEPKKPFHEVVAENLIEQLKAGIAPWQRPWEPGEPNAYLPTNPITGKRYKGINAIHLMAQGRSDGRWMTYKQAVAVGAQVRKGEKSTLVQYWKFSEEQNKVDENGKSVLNAKGEPVKETVQLERPRVFFATVFNAEQIDGLPPIQKKEQTWNAIDRAEHILKASGASITHAPGDRAFYRPATDSIRLPDWGQFPSADNYYATALHELGHWTGHASRLDRDLAHPFGSEGYAKEELRAEIASMILGDELGIGHDPGQHAAYVGSWIKALQDEPLEVFRAAAAAEKIRDYVMAFEKKQVQEQEQEAKMQASEQTDQAEASQQTEKGRAYDTAIKHYTKGGGNEKDGRALLDDTIRRFDVKNLPAALVHGGFATPATADRLAAGLHGIEQPKAAQPASGERQYINVPFKEKDEAKQLGARWDRQQQSWYVPPGVDAAPFARWESAVAIELEKSVVEIGVALTTDRAGESVKSSDLTEYIVFDTAVVPAAVYDIGNYDDEYHNSQNAVRVLATDSGGAVALKEAYDAHRLDVNDSGKIIQRSLIRNEEREIIQQLYDERKTANRLELDKNHNATEEKQKQYLAVPYEQRNAAKAAGALWDKAAKSWYAGPRADVAKLEQWMPENVQAQQGPAMTPREEFAEAMRSAGLSTQGDHPIMDGKRHRVPVEGGKKGALDGFYVGHLDGHPAGRIINNKTGTDITWKSKGYALSDQEKAKLQAEAAEKLAHRAAEQEQAQEATAQRVGRQMADLVSIEQPTPYLQAKGIQTHAGLMTDREGQKTYIPAFDADGKQWTMQYIQENGTKRFARDSKKEGCFHPVGGMDALAAAPALVISEGYATTAQVAEAVGFTTVAAFDSGNLEAVAKALHAKYPEKPIIIAGDDDRHLVMTHGSNPGREKAEAAARAVGGKAIFPIFAPAENTYPRDLPAITPDSFKTHLRAEQRLADAAAGKVELADDETAKLKMSMLSGAQLAALSTMKQHTDFNDLAYKSELGIEGVKRQIGAAISQVQRGEQRQEQKQVEKRQQQLEQRPRRAARIG